MKTLLITFFVFITFFNANKQEDVKMITATFDGYENGIYSFSDAGKEIYYFNRIVGVASEKYDLTGLDFVGDNFKISYKIVLEEVEGEVSTIVHAIVDLKLER